ncbi:MAG: hypothetical protein HY231_07675 [Acidobacteria bacterium]|nr:hypothetical protein [Acidobacteriota bacterium]
MIVESFAKQRAKNRRRSEQSQTCVPQANTGFKPCASSTPQPYGLAEVMAGSLACYRTEKSCAEIRQMD